MTSMIDESVLVIEADAEQARTWQTLLEFADCSSLVVPSPDQAPWQERPWLAALIGQQPGGGALKAMLDSVRRRDASLPILTLDSDPELIRAEALCWSLQPPVKYPHLMDALGRARRHRRQRECGPGFPVGESPAITELSRLLEQVAGFHSTVFPISAGAVGRLPAIDVKLNGVSANTKPSNGRCSM